MNLTLILQVTLILNRTKRNTEKGKNRERVDKDKEVKEINSTNLNLPQASKFQLKRKKKKNLYQTSKPKKIQVKSNLEKPKLIIKNCILLYKRKILKS